jgi:glycosyltransferase involved in cell wall biosynthesis
VYNERGTLAEIMSRVLSVALPEGWGREVVLVDDSSSSGHFSAVQALVDRLRGEGQPLRFLRHEVNQGKGAAVQSGFDAILASHASDNDLVIIQDADLEYDPGDFAALMRPLIDGTADAVVGTRWGGHYRADSLKRRVHAQGNAALTLVSNLMTGIRVSDMECCYKIMPVGLLRRLRPMLSEKRFGIEPQIVAGMARLGARVCEVPVRYEPRGMAEGKKIGWRDGVRALMVIARERFRSGPAGGNSQPRR